MNQLALAGLVLTLALGCSPGAKPPAIANDQPAKAGASDVLLYLPAASNGLIDVDLAAIRATPFGPRADAFLNGVFGDLSLHGGFAKLTSFTWAFAWDGKYSTPPRRVMVLRGPSLDDVQELFTRDGKKPTLDRDGPIVRISLDGHPEATFAYPEERTIVFFMSESRSPAADLRQLVAAGAPLRSKPELMARFDKVSAGQVWAISNIDPFELTGYLASPALPIMRGSVRSAYARIQVTDHVEVEAHHFAADPGSATELVSRTRDDQVEKQTLLGELLATATAPRVDATDNDVRIAFTMTQDQVATGHDVWARWFQQAGK